MKEKRIKINRDNNSELNRKHGEKIAEEMDEKYNNFISL